MSTPTWYCDMDGVLADFETHYKNLFGITLNMQAYHDHGKENVDWSLIQNTKNFFRDIPPMADMMDLWKYIEVYNPIILTGIPSSTRVPEAAKNKRDWIHHHLGKDVQIITTQSSRKCEVCEPGDILIDDWEKYKHKWIAAEGIWITHTSAKNTIQELTKLGY